MAFPHRPGTAPRGAPPPTAALSSADTTTIIGFSEALDHYPVLARDRLGGS